MGNWHQFCNFLKLILLGRWEKLAVLHQCIHAIVPSTILAFLGRTVFSLLFFIFLFNDNRSRQGSFHLGSNDEKNVSSVLCSLSLGYDLFNSALLHVLGLTVMWGETWLLQRQKQPRVVMEKQQKLSSHDSNILMRLRHSSSLIRPTTSLKVTPTSCFVLFFLIHAEDKLGTEMRAAVHEPGTHSVGCRLFHSKVRATYLRSPPCWKKITSMSVSNSAVTRKDFPWLVCKKTETNPWSWCLHKPADAVDLQYFTLSNLFPL